MIYSILKQKEIPVLLTKDVKYVEEIGDVTRYDVYDDLNGTYIGQVKLADTQNGVRVLYINNAQQDSYKHFGNLADQIEVEHCIKRGINKPYIQSAAARNTYIQHFLRGKRFINDGVNIYLDNVIKNLSKGEKKLIEFLGYQKMYMPVNMLKNIKEKIKKNPLLLVK